MNATFDDISVPAHPSSSDAAGETALSAKQLELFAKTMQRCDAVAAVYPMPCPQENGVLRFAAIARGGILDASAQLDRALHGLELGLGRIIDFFPFTRLNCPQCKEGQALFERDGQFVSDGSGYDPYDEDDPANEDKLRLIERFASVLNDHPEALEAVRGHEERDDRHEQPYLDDWAAYFNDYPIALQLAFYRSRSVHLKDICASSPILAHASEWTKYE